MYIYMYIYIYIYIYIHSSLYIYIYIYIYIHIHIHVSEYYISCAQNVEGDLDRAHDLHKRAVQLQPGNAEALGALAALLSSARGDLEAAHDLYLRSLPPQICRICTTHAGCQPESISFACAIVAPIAQRRGARRAGRSYLVGAGRLGGRA